jgi:hypothetical protein
MKRSFTTTLVLLVVCAGLIAWYAIYEKKIKKTNSDAEEKAKQLVSLDKDQIQELAIRWIKNPPDKEGPPNAPPPEIITVKLQKTGTDWNLVEPVKDSADNSSVVSMLSTLTTTKQERVIEEKPKDLEIYGLKPPIITVTFKKDASAPTQELYLGKKTPTGFSAYAKSSSGQTVYRVPQSMLNAFEKDAKTLRNKNVLSVSRFEVGELEIHLAKEDVLLKKDEKDNWTLTRDNFPADVSEVNNTLNAIVDLKATDFASEDGSNLEKYGLSSPLAKIVLTRSKDKSRVSLALGKSKDKVYVKRDDKPIVYEVDKGILDKVIRPSAVYRNKELATFNRFDVKRIKLEKGKESLELVKVDSGWTLAGDPKGKIDGAKVDSLLTEAQDTKIVDYLPAKTPSSKFSQPPLVLRIFETKDKTETEKVTLTFAKAVNHKVAVQRAAFPVPFEINEDDFKKMLLTKEELLKVEVKPEIQPGAKPGNPFPGSPQFDMKNLQKVQGK